MHRKRIQRTLPRLTAGLLLAALPLLATAGQGGSGPVTLRMKFKQGETSKYQTNMSVTMAGMGGPKGAPGKAGGVPMQQIAVLQQFKTDKLLPGGGAEVVVTTINMQGAAGMGSTPVPKPVTLIMDARGGVKVAKASQSATGSMMGSMMGANPLGLQQVPMPEKAVKPGDTWSSVMAMPGMGSGSVKGQFVKYETVGKHKTALLHYVVTMPIKMMMDASMQPTTSAATAQMTMSGNMVMNVDNDVAFTDGKLVRSSGNGTMVMTITSKGGMGVAPPKPGTAVKPTAPKGITVNTLITMGTTLVD